MIYNISFRDLHYVMKQNNHLIHAVRLKMLVQNKKLFRSRQGSNLRGETPLDFKSNALTTRPRLLTENLEANCPTIF